MRVPPADHPADGEKAKEALDASTEGVRGLSDNVKTAAQSYRDGEEGNAQPFERQLTAAPRTAEVRAQA